jgi:hypothetical protein
MANVLMKCGCRANSSYMGKPACVIHALTDRGAYEVAETPDLTGRTAKCHYCNYTSPSSLSLPFFAFHPERGSDDFYCGCRGWD